jgi:phage repressor protein C with HTH and peptisase S24 domain
MAEKIHYARRARETLARSQTLQKPPGQTSEGGSTFALRFAFALSGEKPFAFAKRTELPDSSIRKYLAGTEPSVGQLVVLADALGVSVEWLASGRGEMRAPGSKTDDAAQPSDGLVAVPMLSVRPSAGAGGLAGHLEEQPELVAFREEWLRRIGVSPKAARLMIAKGDSMSDTINDGDLMVVDVSIREIVDEGVYVLVYGGLVLVKRIQMLTSGVLLLKSDNPRYETERVHLNEQPELIVEGRVRWAGGSV